MYDTTSVINSLLLDDLFSGYQEVLGEDYDAYRNHCLRVFNFCCALARKREVDLDKIAVAVFFHDLGIWTEKSFDYLPASQLLARSYLEKNGKGDWQSEIEAMIGEHHKLTRYKEHPEWLVELFRKADWIDMTGGLLRFRLKDDFVTDVLEAFPNAGFHRKLVQLAVERFKSHPFSPLPMMKL
ncbi:HD domain-containing protein [Chlorobium sp. BLA1]|uniref:HD domain-containing protein n=1 Tax=Candidatus Chlorobium masyuteum TaxID=2716876 RepID=UPI00141E7DF7|nr:HD domain-containing protein [Candidatus Chlorobium masyuteum]NHQ59980.1 HD domain-containing protein [Candidatus Chlorobium masyuteum]NTU44826.1 HD domain-containing protein [Chlorobiaceae bacterium]